MFKRLTRAAVALALVSAFVMPASALASGASKDVGYAARGRVGSLGERTMAHRPTTSTRALSAFSLAVDPDAYEVDDDIPQAISDAQLPLVQSRTINIAHYDDPYDVDWDYYRLTGTAGTLYTFETTGTTDTVIELWDADTGEMLGWEDDKSDGSLGSKGYWRCRTAGQRVDVWIGPANPDAIGEYTMSITGAASSSRAGDVFRAYGADKYDAAVNIAHSAYSDVDGDPWNYYVGDTTKAVSRVIVVPSGSAGYLAAMIAAPLGRVFDAPILLTGKYTLPFATKSAINDIRDNNGGSVKIYLIGSKSWISSSVYYKLKALRGSGTIERVAGSDRYGTAALVADKVDTMWVGNMGQHPGSVIVANGSSSSALTDLLAASGIAYGRGWPVLLTKAGSVPSSTYSRVRKGKFKSSRVIVPNSRTYVYSSTYKSLSGDLRLSSHSDRAASALDIARRSVSYYWTHHDDIVVVNRVSEALPVATYAGYYGAPILVSGTSGPGASTTSYITARPSMIDYVSVVGSPEGITDGAITVYEGLLP